MNEKSEQLRFAYWDPPTEPGVSVIDIVEPETDYKEMYERKDHQLKAVLRRTKELQERTTRAEHDLTVRCAQLEAVRRELATLIRGSSTMTSSLARLNEFLGV